MLRMPLSQATPHAHVYTPTIHSRKFYGRKGPEGSSANANLDVISTLQGGMSYQRCKEGKGVEAVNAEAVSVHANVALAVALQHTCMYGQPQHRQHFPPAAENCTSTV
eukprot:scaffold198564_cov36-Prasinocladus_malaysianus.AAC.1